MGFIQTCGPTSQYQPTSCLCEVTPKQEYVDKCKRKSLWSLYEKKVPVQINSLNIWRDFSQTSEQVLEVFYHVTKRNCHRFFFHTNYMEIFSYFLLHTQISFSKKITFRQWDMWSPHSDKPTHICHLGWLSLQRHWTYFLYKKYIDCHL